MLCGINVYGHGEYTVEGIQALADALRVTAPVTSVSLLYNNFDAETATMLLKVKEEHTALKTLCGFTHNEINLDLIGQPGKRVTTRSSGCNAHST